MVAKSGIAVGEVTPIINRVVDFTGNDNQKMANLSIITAERVYKSKER